jgi:hypothetical protein
MDYGTPVSPNNIGLSNVLPFHTHYIVDTHLSMSRTINDCDTHASSDSFAELIFISESSDSDIKCDVATPDTSEDKMEWCWIQTKDWPKDACTCTKCVTLEKKRWMS